MGNFSYFLKSLYFSVSLVLHSEGSVVGGQIHFNVSFCCNLLFCFVFFDICLIKRDLKSYTFHIFASFKNKDCLLAGGKMLYEAS